MEPKETRQLDRLLFSAEPTPATFTTGDLGLMGTWEVAHYLGVEKSRIARWLQELGEGKTPIAPPRARLKSGSLWAVEDVEAKLESMYAEAKKPYGDTSKGLRRWARERREARAAREAAVASQRPVAA
jgi:hypothetical protein